MRVGQLAALIATCGVCMAGTAWALTASAGRPLTPLEPRAGQAAGHLCPLPGQTAWYALATGEFLTCAAISTALVPVGGGGHPADVN